MLLYKTSQVQGRAVRSRDVIRGILCDVRETSFANSLSLLVLGACVREIRNHYYYYYYFGTKIFCIGNKYKFLKKKW